LVLSIQSAELRVVPIFSLQTQGTHYTSRQQSLCCSE
jgi:hypothetical protein